MNKLGKFAAACAAVLCAFGAFGDVFLKPLGPDETREVQDGQSWATAYATVADAIANVESGVPIRAAKGVYVISATITPVSKNVVIRGGYDGASDAEPDPAANPTIFTGDQTQDDVWQHVEPVLGEFRYEKTDTEKTVIDADGKVSAPGAFTVRFDGYVAKFIGTNTSRGFQINQGTTIDIDGVTFTGFAGHGAVAYVNSYNGTTNVFSRCTFVGNRPTLGAVYFNYTNNSSAVNRFKDCAFAYNYSSTGKADEGASCVSGIAPITVNGCSFLSCMSEGSQRANCLYLEWQTPRVCNNTFERCDYVTASAPPTKEKGPGNVFVPGHAVSGMVFTNNLVKSCLSASAGSPGVPIVMVNTTSSSADNFHDNIFFGNRVEANPAANSTTSLLNGEDGTVYTCVLSCSFVSNQVVAVAPTATSGRYALATVGFNSSSRRLAVVNSSFDSNEIIAPETTGVTVLKCRGAAIAGHAASGSPQMGVCNCTFYGPDEPGVYDLVQWGDTPKNELLVVNSIFSTEGEIANPFFADDPTRLRVANCSIKNLQTLPAGVTFWDLETDEIPLVRSTEPVALGVPPVLYPAAQAPNIKKVMYVRRCDRGHNAFAEFTFDSSWLSVDPFNGWQSRLISVLTTWRANDSTGCLDADLRGNPRSSSDSMRGAMNQFAVGVAGTHTLILRRDPIAQGTFSPAGGTRPVADGASVTVTAVPKAGAAFEGWYTPEGEMFADTATLSIGAMTSDLTLVAKFTVPPVKLTFDLNGVGTFANGETTKTVEAMPGAVFPTVPGFTEGDEWAFKAWNPSLPEFTPAEDTTYVAQRVSKALRIIKVVPAAEAGAVQDGTTWATAYSDLQAAYDDAGIYRGEIWLKKGKHVATGSVIVKANVALRGGFAGEAEIETPDPVANKTTIDGGKSVSIGFATANALATNIVFEGVTFTGFKSSVFYSIDHKCDDARFLGCTFDNNATNGGNDDQPVYVAGSRIEVAGCVFTNNNHAIRLTASAKAVVTDTLFAKNRSKYGGACVFMWDKGSAYLTNCTMVANSASGDGWRCGPTVSSYDSGSTVHLTNCRILNNTGSETLGVLVNYGGTYRLEKCRVSGNSLTQTGAGQSACSGLFTAYGTFLVFDSEVSCNTNILNGARAGNVGGLVHARSNARFVNTSFEGNVTRFEQNGGTATAAPFLVTGGGVLALVHSTVDGTAITAGWPEIKVTGGNAVIVNSVIENEAKGYDPLVSGQKEVGVSHSFIRNFDASKVTTGSNGFLYEVASSGGRMVARHETSAEGIRQAVASGATANGRPVWMLNGVPYIYDTVKDPSKPWRPLNNLSSYAASVSGLTVDSPLVPDAFGKARPKKAPKLGSVQFDRGFMLLVR